MSLYRSSRSHSVVQARVQRDAARAQKEFERQLKEQAKLDQVAQARLEVAASENQFEVLLSLHKECAPDVDWIALASALQPAEPMILATDARREWRLKLVSNPAGLEPDEPHWQSDRLDHPQRRAAAEAVRNWEKNKALAERVLVGDESAFIEALGEFSFIDEVAQLGTSIEFTVHAGRDLEINVRCNDTWAIPAVAKSLTAAGKVTEKPIPRARFHEIYQDHVCSSLLRVAREAMAVLPVERLIVNGHAMIRDSAKGMDTIEPIYSVLIPRGGLAPLNFELLDPSDAIESFSHRGDFKGSRKAGAFQAIQPLRFDEPESVTAQTMNLISLAALRRRVGEMRDMFDTLRARDRVDSHLL